MLSSLNTTILRFWMNLDKAKVMFNVHDTPESIYVEDVALEVVQEYVKKLSTFIALYRTAIVGLETTSRVKSLDECNWAGQCLKSCVKFLGYPCHNALRPRYSATASYHYDIRSHRI